MAQDLWHQKKNQGWISTLCNRSDNLFDYIPSFSILEVLSFYFYFFKVHILPLLLRRIKPLNNLTFPLNYKFLTFQGETKRCKANLLYRHLWWPHRSFWSTKCFFFMPQNRDSCAPRTELFFLGWNHLLKLLSRRSQVLMYKPKFSFLSYGTGPCHGFLPYEGSNQKLRNLNAAKDRSSLQGITAFVPHNFTHLIIVWLGWFLISAQDWGGC